MKRNPSFFRRPARIPDEDVLLARWLMGETMFQLVKDGLVPDHRDIWERGYALLTGIGRERPLEMSTVANLLCEGDVERLRRALD